MSVTGTSSRRVSSGYSGIGFVISRKSAGSKVLWYVIILLPWLRFLLRAGTFIIRYVLIMVRFLSVCGSVSVFVICGSVVYSNCL